MKLISTNRGISLLEIMITLGSVAILAAVAMGISGNNSLGVARETKLRHDVAALNSAVTAYLHSGGDLSGLKDPATVVAKLKMKANSAEVALTPGFSGSFLDENLVPEIRERNEEDKPSLRAVWNPNRQKFELKETKAAGIVKMNRVTTLDQTGPNTESRDRLVSYASKGNWVWDYEDAPLPTARGPSSFPVTSIPNSGLPSPNPVPPLPPTASQKQVLQAPGFSIPGGTMPAPNFPLRVSLTNFNPPGVSTLAYSIDYAAWAPYSGSSISVSPDTILRAQAVPIDSSKWDPSLISSEEYLARLLRLSPPNIYFNSDFFSSNNGGAITTIQVALTNPNSPGISKIKFQILPVPGGGGTTTDFEDYSGSFSVQKADYPSGFGVRTFAEAIDPGYQNSTTVSRFASDQSGLFGGHLDLDTSDFITQVGGGSTEAHTHDITGKYDITSIDFFNIPDGKQITIPEAVKDPNQPFKITVVNADLSPGMTLIMKTSKNGTSQTIQTNVSDYDDTAPADLTTFTLSGSGNTTRLEGITIGMDRDIILQAGVVPTNTGDVKDNTLGKQDEWRNGALTVQAVAVAPNGDPLFSLNPDLSSGGHGAADSGLLWEGALFWHWEGDSYHDRGNQYRPGDLSSIIKHVEDIDLSNITIVPNGDDDDDDDDDD